MKAVHVTCVCISWAVTEIEVTRIKPWRDASLGLDGWMVGW